MCVSFGFTTVLLLGKAECEEDPCSLCMHTTFGFQRGYDGLMFHRGSSDPARGGVASSGSQDDHKYRNRTW